MRLGNESKNFVFCFAFLSAFTTFVGMESTITSLSILIPAYNSDCAALVADLSRLAEKVDGLAYEILVAEDGSDDPQTVAANSAIISLPHCRHLRREVNVGRAAIRNALAREARYGHLLFIDSHMSVVSDDYLRRYLACTDDDLVCGGYTITTPPAEGTRNLRYAYERSCLTAQDATERSRTPHAQFHTSNFMVRRDIMLAHPLDERFTRYGYEDVLFGKSLASAGIAIRHIDNPLGFDRFESNSRFMQKTDESIETLTRFADELRGYSRLLDFSDTIRRRHLHPLCSLAYRLTGKAIRRQLTGNHPSLLLFKVYKVLKIVSESKN